MIRSEALHAGAVLPRASAESGRRSWGTTVLIAVVGSSGLNRGRGDLLATIPAALLQADDGNSGRPRHPAGALVRGVDRQGAGPRPDRRGPGDQRRGAHPPAPPPTLTLIGAAAQQAAGPDADPGPGGPAGQRVGGAVAQPGLVSPGLGSPRAGPHRTPAAGQHVPLRRGTSARSRPAAGPGAGTAGSPVAPNDEVYVAGASPAPAAPPPRRRRGPLDAVELEPDQPYATRSAVPLTVLAGADAACRATSRPARPATPGWWPAAVRSAVTPARRRPSLAQVLESVDHG